MDETTTEALPCLLEAGKDTAVFTTQTPLINETAYEEQRTLHLQPGKLTLEVRLRNIGIKTLHLLEYCHNFVSLGETPVGPGPASAASGSGKFKSNSGGRGADSYQYRDLLAANAGEGFFPAEASGKESGACLAAGNGKRNQSRGGKRQLFSLLGIALGHQLLRLRGSLSKPDSPSGRRSQLAPNLEI